MKHSLPTTLDATWFAKCRARCTQVEQAMAHWPDGIPLTAQAAREAHALGLDVVWAGMRLMTVGQQMKFILFTLRQRQPHLARADPGKARRVFLAAKEDAAWDAAWDAWDAARRSARIAARDARAAARRSARVAARDAQVEEVIRIMGLT